MSRRSMRYFHLWSIDSQSDDKLWPQLQSCLLAAARYLGVSYHPQDVYLKERMSVRKAIDFAGQKLKLASYDTKHPLGGLPIIALSRESQELVLLIPQGSKYYKIYNNNSGLIPKKLITNYFNECIELYRCDLTSNLNQALRSYFPTKIILVAQFFKLVLSVLYFLASIFIIQDNNYIILVIFSMLLFILIILLDLYIYNISVKNYFLVHLWAQYQLFYRVFYLDLERYAQTSWSIVKNSSHELYRGVKNYFLQRSYLYLSSILLLASIILLAYFNWVASFIYLLALIISLYLSFLLGQREAQLHDEALICQQNFEQSLQAFNLSFSMAVGLKAQASLLDRIQENSALLASNSQKRAYTQRSALILSIGFLIIIISILVFLDIKLSLIDNLILIITLACMWWAHRVVINYFLSPQAQPVSNSVGEHLAFLEPESSLRVQPMNIQGNIEVHDVSFAYAKSSALIIKNASINFSAGKLYLLCGPSGSGKSTLLKLLMTQEIAPAGQIIFDGQDVRSLELDELRKNFGVIKQDSSVFSGSIRANILCGRDISHAHLEDLLLSHEIYDVILDLPMGLETYVFDNATNISRLQLVIILLARALVHKPKILFLDEIFKGLNLEQQAIMSKYLYDLNITRIIISHDIKNMSYDHIVTSKDWSN